MRLWSLHPSYLDAKGLVAAWRESLLAQAVLRGKTKGYRNHPQLARFKSQRDPVAAIGAYLDGLAQEAKSRGYGFNDSLIHKLPRKPIKIKVTSGQMDYELEHLKRKLRVRDPKLLKAVRSKPRLEPHALFKVVPGDVEDWEII